MEHRARCLVLLLLPVMAPVARAQGPNRQRVPLRVEAVSPAPNARDVSDSTTIEVRFKQPVAPRTLETTSLQVMGRWSGVHTGTTTYVDGVGGMRFTPDEPFSAGELVTVHLTRALPPVSGAALEHAETWSFWVDARGGTASFTLIATLTPGDIPYGAHGGDINADGQLDLCIPNEGSADVSVFLNNGAGFDPAVSYDVGARCSANEGADLDLDGNIDLIVANIDDDDLSVLLGNGDGTFRVQDRYDVGDQPRGVTLIDVEGDGDLDAVAANRLTNDLSVLLNGGDGMFGTEARMQGGVDRETGVSAADMDLDGIFDVVVIGFNNDRIRTLIGDGAGGFTAAASTTIGAMPWMVVTGDVDCDGDVDAAVAAAGSAVANVVLNDGDGTFGTVASYAAGGFPIAVDLGDIDGDGLLDLTASSFSSGTFSLYYNQGAGVMGGGTTLSASIAGSCTVLHDVDGDGDVDITGIDELADEVYIFRQDG